MKRKTNLTEQEQKLLSIFKIGRENIKTTKELLKECNLRIPIEV